jgi:ABC-type polysaccharide/polyol phosphate export permease
MGIDSLILFVLLRYIGDIYQVFLRALFIITPLFDTMTFLGHGTAKSIVLLNPLTQLINFLGAVGIKGEFISM